MRVERHCVIDADRDTVWKVVSDPDCYPSFMANLARWELRALFRELAQRRVLSRLALRDEPVWRTDLHVGAVHTVHVGARG